MASLVGDVAVKWRHGHLQDHRILAYPYETEKPVAGLGAKYRWARNAGLLFPILAHYTLWGHRRESLATPLPSLVKRGARSRGGDCYC